MATKKKSAATSGSTAPTTTKLQRHPLSEKFSLPTTEEERLALATDIEAHGQHQEIILFEGMVLDGWERYMACLQKGITPKFKEYTGSDPASVAFGANAIRRRLSAVQKALFGAKYLLHCQAEGVQVTQQQVAKLACCSLQRLNQISQLLRAVDGNAAAAQAAAALNTNPDITAGMLQTMLVDAGIVELNTRRATADDEHADGHDDEDDDATPDNSVDDLLGGADIDDLLDGDDDDEPASRRTPEPRGDKGNSTGVRLGPDKRARETPASVAAKTFKALTEPERADFVKFTWSMLRPAVEACLKGGRVEWPAAGVDADPGAKALAESIAALAKAADKGDKPAAAKGDKPAKGRRKAAA
jgi:hypothetical protein